MNSVFEKKTFYPYCFTPKIIFLQNFYPKTLSLLFVEGHLRAYNLLLSTGSTQEGLKDFWLEMKELIQTK